MDESPTPPLPRHAPLFCGALGDYDPDRVESIAHSLGRGLRIAHSDERSVLWLDRPPIVWGAGRTRGWAWGTGTPKPATASSWRHLAAGPDGSGLVSEGPARFLHSSASGLCPIYYLEQEGATYFASGIDALVRGAAPAHRLSIDWSSWAAICLLTAPLGEGTPFAEVRRLAPFSRLEHRRGGPRSAGGEWPWAELSPRGAGGEGGAAAVLESLRHGFGAGEGGRLACPLSGGWDSRLLLALAREGGRPVSALTLGASRWRAGEERYARAVAAELGAPLSRVPPARSYWGDFREAALRSDHQTTHHAWLLPLARRLARGRAPALDGLAGGVLLQGSFVSAEMLRARSARTRLGLLWQRLSNARKAEAVLTAPFARALAASAREAWEREAAPFADHPNGPSLIAYRTRTVRAISLAPLTILGAGATVLTPFTDERVVRAALSVRPAAKLDGALYRQIFDLLDPGLGRLPSAHDPPPAAAANAEAAAVADDARRLPAGAEREPAAGGDQPAAAGRRRRRAGASPGIDPGGPHRPRRGAAVTVAAALRGRCRGAGPGRPARLRPVRRGPQLRGRVTSTTGSPALMMPLSTPRRSAPRLAASS